MFTGFCFQCASNRLSSVENMKNKKYLIYLSYIGTRYRGMQKQTPADIPDPTTICGWLEIALKKVSPLNTPGIFVASRTDQGVHALRTAIHCNLVLDFGPLDLVKRLNRFFTKTGHDIYIQEARVVPEEFDARRSAKMRSYLYRFAIRKDTISNNSTQPDFVSSGVSNCLPVQELNRCYFEMNPEFKVDAAEAAIKRMSGTNDFRGFVGKPSRTLREGVRTVRIMTDIQLSPGQPYLPTHPYTDAFNFWNITCSSRSFLYNQIRRIVGIVLAVGQGKVTLDEVELLFNEPSFDNWPRLAKLAPACGLYKTNVVYNEEDLNCNVQNENSIDRTVDNDVAFIHSLHVSTIQELTLKLKNFKGNINEKINLKKKLLDSVNKQKT